MSLKEIGQRARAAEPVLRTLSIDQKNQVLQAVAAALTAQQQKILEANEADVEHAKAAGMKAGLVDRLQLTKDRIAGMAEGLLQLVNLEDPI